MSVTRSKWASWLMGEGGIMLMLVMAGAIMSILFTRADTNRTNIEHHKAKIEHAKERLEKLEERVSALEKGKK